MRPEPVFLHNVGHANVLSLPPSCDSYLACTMMWKELKMMLARTGSWMNGSDGRQYLVYRYVEVDWALRDDDTLNCLRGLMYYETSTGLRVIRVGVNTFKILPTGIYLAEDQALSTDHDVSESRPQRIHGQKRSKVLELALAG